MRKCKLNFDVLDPVTKSGQQALRFVAGWLCLLTLAGLVVLAAGPLARGQEFIANAYQPLLADGEVALASASLLEAPGVCSCGCGSGRKCLRNTCWFGGVDYLWVRPHFSEAVAFTRGSQSPTTYQTVAEELGFDYDSSLRAFAGFRLADGNGAIRLTYWYLDGDTSVDGTVSGPGQFIVDPFGNLVGTVAIIDPSDARFPGVLVGATTSPRRPRS